MCIEEIKKLADQIGFTDTGQVNMDALVPLKEVRDMCSADKCERYGKNWGCPPSPVCQSIEDSYDKMHEYEDGILCQYTARMDDEFDMVVIAESAKKHKSMFDTLIRQLKLMNVECMPLSAGSCTRCRKCTYPDKPCRYPDKLYPSMEAYGLWVSDVCEKSGMKYNHGENSITYTACVLVKEVNE